jgi:hypothetical protein
MDGRDVVYSVGIQVGDTLVADVESLWNPGLYVVGDCANPSGTCVAASYSENESHTQSIAYSFTSPGMYYLVVDGPAGTSGPFHLSGRLTGTTVGVEPGEKPSSTALLRVAPNPAGSIARLSGYLPGVNDGEAELIIHDVTGRRIAAMRIPVRAGHFETTWNTSAAVGGSLPAGVYSVRVRGGGIERRQMLVVVR